MQRGTRTWLLIAAAAPLAACQLFLSFGAAPDASPSASEAGTEASALTDGAPDDGAPSDAAIVPDCGSDASFTSDPKNCGRCGHDCLGGACDAGSCEPALVTTGQTSSFWLGVDSTSIAWINGTDVRVCDKRSCAKPTTIASGRPSVREVAIGGGNVFWTECVDSDASDVGGVFACPVGGCTGAIAPIWHGRGCAMALAYDPSHGLVYFSDGADGSVYSCDPANCGSAVAVATKQYAYVNTVTVADERVYWIQSAAGLFGCTSPNCAPSGSQQIARSSIIDTAPASIVGTRAFWTTVSSGYTTAQIDPLLIPQLRSTGGYVLSAPIDGDGGDAQVVLDRGAPTAVVADPTGIRFTDCTAGAIFSCPLDGCGDAGPTLLSIGQGKPFALVQDEAAIYWANFDDGRIMKLAK